VEKTSAQAEHIPDKKYFRIGEVSRIVGVDTHVLRYWETEFPGIHPHRAKSRQRLYRQNDVRYLLAIKKLLHEDGYTISGARKVLKGAKLSVGAGVTSVADHGHRSADNGKNTQDKLGLIKNELHAILQRVTAKK